MISWQWRYLANFIQLPSNARGDIPQVNPLYILNEKPATGRMPCHRRYSRAELERRKQFTRCCCIPNLDNVLIRGILGREPHYVPRIIGRYQRAAGLPFKAFNAFGKIGRASCRERGWRLL